MVDYFTMKCPKVEKSQALAAYGGNGAALARALGITRQAVSAMPDGLLDERHAMKLYFVLKPDFFQCGASEGFLSGAVKHGG